MITKFHYFALVYYRLIGITFGGARVNQKRELESFLPLKIYSYVAIIIILLITPIKSYLKNHTPEMMEIFQYENQYNFIIKLIYVVETIRFVQIAANMITLNYNGNAIIKLSSKYKMTNTHSQIIFRSLWLCHVIIPLIIMIAYFTLIRLSIQGMVFIFTEMFVEFQMSFALGLITWWLSLCVWEQLNKIKNQIINCEPTPYLLIYNRKLFIEARKLIEEMDEKLAISFIIDAVGTIVGLMIQIYVSIIGIKKLPIIGKFYRSYIFGTVASTIKLIASCVINGYVHEEADQVTASLDDIYIKRNNDLAYKELIIFMSISKDVKFGFTIADFMPWKKTTLLSVSEFFHFNLF